jgi:hypothetical protein
MQYLFLLYNDETLKMSPEQGAQARARQWAILDETTQKGVLRGASPLQSSEASISVRSHSGSVVTTDGPFAETKEALGGFYLIECRDAEEAKYWGGRLAQTGCATGVEIRPLAQIPARVEKTEDDTARAMHA